MAWWTQPKRFLSRWLLEACLSPLHQRKSHLIQAREEAQILLEKVIEIQKSIQTKLECELAPLLDDAKLQRRVGGNKREEQKFWMLIDYLWYAELVALVSEGGLRAFDTTLDTEIYILTEFEAFLTAEVIEELWKPKIANSPFDKLTTNIRDLRSLKFDLLSDSTSIFALLVQNATYKDVERLLANHRLLYQNVLSQSLRKLTTSVLSAATRNWVATKFARCGLNYEEIESGRRLGFLSVQEQTGIGKNSKQSKEEAIGELGGIGCPTHPSPFLGAWFSNYSDALSSRAETYCPRLTSLCRGPSSPTCLDDFSIKPDVPDWVPIFHPKRWPRSIPKTRLSGRKSCPSSQYGKQQEADYTEDWQGLKDTRENTIRSHRYCVRSMLNATTDRQGERRLQLGVMEQLENQKEEEGFCFGG